MATPMALANYVPAKARTQETPAISTEAERDDLHGLVAHALAPELALAPSLAPDAAAAAQDEPKEERLNHLAELVSKLTYGEMTEIARLIWQARPVRNNRKLPLDTDTLPKAWFRWARERSS